ncbi:hypothetical protein [Novosphingobium guangzhouense]|uniref:Uncharacterized protein n=1 Tax=Novosphingobium guangzhouense TaxID=1850347 RepID=A0A2K2FTP5_9SPHN|nr:hypothetical protein [Novosphingobium guangzhouense]PNU02167.1 hypothetical protein A8V01_09835 [Novosphingobium guangzhouense]
MLDFVTIGAALLASLGGLFLLWHGWKTHADMRLRAACVALLWSMSAAIWIWRFGAEIGIPLALETAALVAFGFILTRMERREERPARKRAAIVDAAASSSRGSWRRYVLGTVRVLVAGPLGLIAAMAIAVVIATRTPMAEQTRLILAGLIVPTLWAIGIGWVVCHRRLAVQAASFATIGAAGIGLTLLAGA